MFIYYKLNFLHRLFSLKALIVLALFAFASQASFAQSGSKKKKREEAKQEETKKDDASEIDLSTIDWPEYYTNYASGGDFRNGREFSTDEKYLAPYILSVPVLMTKEKNMPQALKIWKETIYAAFKGDEPAMYKGGNPDVSMVPKAIDSQVDFPLYYTGKKPAFDLPFWVKDYLNEEDVINRLYTFQVSLGNIIYVSDDILFPLMYVLEEDASEELKLEEAAKYYTAIYRWSLAYPYLFDAINDPNLRYALENKDLNLLYKFGQYRFPLSEEIITSMRIEKKSKKTIQ